MATIENFAQRIFQMTDEVWARHANPWSVWTRYPSLPLLVLAIYSYHWVGIYNLAFVAIVCLWVWVNPRIFGVPKSTSNWASKAVFGERILIYSPKSEIPTHHKKSVTLLKVIMSASTLITLTGLVTNNIPCVIFGVSAVIISKTLFLNRMVKLFEDLAPNNKKYQSWITEK